MNVSGCVPCSNKPLFVEFHVILKYQNFFIYLFLNRLKVTNIACGSPKNNVRPNQTRVVMGQVCLVCGMTFVLDHKSNKDGGTPFTPQSDWHTMTTYKNNPTEWMKRVLSPHLFPPNLSKENIRKGSRGGAIRRYSVCPLVYILNKAPDFSKRKD